MQKGENSPQDNMLNTSVGLRATCIQKGHATDQAVVFSQHSLCPCKAISCHIIIVGLSNMGRKVNRVNALVV